MSGFYKYIKSKKPKERRGAVLFVSGVQIPQTKSKTLSNVMFKVNKTKKSTSPPVRNSTHAKLLLKMKKKNNAATLIQKTTRMLQAKKKIKNMKNTRKQSAITKIQKQFRGYKQRKLATPMPRKGHAKYNTPGTRCNYTNKQKRKIINNKLTQYRKISSASNTGSESNVYILKTSKSPSQIVLKKNPSNRLICENEYNNYKYFNHMIKYKVTPFVLQNIDVGYRCTNQKHSLYTETYSNLTKLNDYLDKILFGSSHDYIYQIMFQLLYTLDCMNRIGLRHNDLHPGNIFVFEINQKSPKMKYHTFELLDGTTYTLPLFGPQIRIFDLDRTVKSKPPRSNNPIKSVFRSETGKETLNELEETFGKIYNDKKYLPWFDTYKVLHTMTKHTPSLKKVPIIKKLLSEYDNFNTNQYNFNSFWKSYNLLCNPQEEIVNIPSLPTPRDLIKKHFDPAYKQQSTKLNTIVRYKQRNLYL